MVADTGPFFHGTKADLDVGDLLRPGYSSNFGERRTANFIYLTATLDAAILGAEALRTWVTAELWRFRYAG